MIRVTVLYPNKPGIRFDLAYYVEKHCPMVMELLGGACRGFGVDQGIAGVMPAGEPAYRVVAHFLFDTLEDFQDSFGPNAAAIAADIPNYTDLQPIIQVGEVRE